LADAQRRKHLVVVGGDFNAQLGIGLRSDLLYSLVDNFHLEIGNADTNHTKGMSTWTFCSSMGVKRRIDYILFSKQFSFMECHACDKFDLGSDHRAVYAQLSLPTCRHFKRKRYVQTKRGWKPELDENKVPNEYHAALSENMLGKQPDSISEVEQIVKAAALACDRSRAHKHKNQQENSSLTPPWTQGSFQNLLDERRSAT
jgi:hypothetical protein